MRRKRIFQPSHRGTDSLAADSPVFSHLSNHRAAQRFTGHSFRSFPFIDVRVAETYRSARHSQQIREIEMTLYLGHIGEANLQVETKKSQESVRFAQQAQDVILGRRLLKNASKNLGCFLDVREFVAVFKRFARGCISRRKATVFVESQPEDVIVGVATRQGGAGKARGKR